MILLNGTMVESGAPDLSLLNRGFKYGDGLFESMRIVHGKALLLDEHLHRLKRGMIAMYLEVPDDFEQELRDGIGVIVEENKIADYGRIRLAVYRGGEGAYLPTDNSPRYLIEAYSLKENPAVNAAITLGDYPAWPLSPNPLTGFKTANAMPYIMAANYARRKGYDEAVLYCNGKVSEASSANIFIVKNKRVYTPALATSCCLDGVMRRQIFKACSQLKIAIKEASLSKKDVLNADEVFLTNSVRGIIPVGSYLTRSFHPGYGPISGFLHNSLENFLTKG